jgi:hypothetical protein
MPMPMFVCVVVVGRAGDVAYLAHVERDALPFDRGCWGNLREYLTRPARGEYAFVADADGALPRHRLRCCFS